MNFILGKIKLYVLFVVTIVLLQPVNTLLHGAAFGKNLDFNPFKDQILFSIDVQDIE